MVRFERARRRGDMAGQHEWDALFANASTSAMSLYDEILVPRWFEPWARLLLDILKPENGQAVLDVACGPGTVTRLVAQLVGLEGSVTGCDLSPAMLELARSKISVNGSAPITYLECPADALAFPDDAFDLVTCQQGLQFFPNRNAALAEVRRVLRPGGKLGIAVWCAIEECPPCLALANALEQALGTEVADAYKGGPWGLSDATSLVDLANDSGFTNVEVRKYELPVVFDGGPGQLSQSLRVTSVAATLAQLSEASQIALATAVEDAARQITENGIVRSHTASHILTAEANGK
ncbi:MAG TPA: class I SAM-dependent methyltransferase [Acidimicrobiales bacterium]|nr:class I SAM-dependent methyltransferase [Acidimicrobiales bacterium]